MIWAPAALLTAGAFLSAWWLTGRVRRYALARRVVDVPNARSSHVLATPRGGGVAIVVSMLAAVPVLCALGAMTRSHAIGLFGGGALVALLGFADDHRHIDARWRLIGHFAAAAWVVAWMGGLPPLTMFGVMLQLGWLGHLLAAVYLVWLLNLTNFMDGIDGLAGLEAVMVSAGGALLYVVAVPGSTTWLVPVVLASATCGFLLWNWPPAKIFLGDAGSGFLGLMLAALSLQAARVSPSLFWGWIILLGAFVVDATVTLLRRMARRHRVDDAHRSHAYQHATDRWAAHQPVTLAIGAIDVFWLLPVALLVGTGRLDGLLGVLIAYAPLVVAALWLRAGETAQPQLT